MLFLFLDFLILQFVNYSVYILYSEKLDRFYIGTTDDVDRRISEHNTGHYEDSFTSKGQPWKLILVIDTLTSAQAYSIEAHIKKMK